MQRKNVVYMVVKGLYGTFLTEGTYPQNWDLVSNIIYLLYSGFIFFVIN